MNNISKTQAQDGLPLSIVFWWILVGFGRHVGLENRAKSEKKSIGKRIEKIMKKRCLLAAPGGGESTHGPVSRRVFAPLITNYQLPTPHHSPQTTAHRPQEHLVTPYAHSAVADTYP